MKLKLDENLGRRCKELLENMGHDVATVYEERLEGSPDTRVITVCKSESRCLVTLDLDFANPLRFPPQEFPGIAVLRQSGRITADGLDACLRTLGIGLAQEDIEGRLWIVERSRIRKHEDR